LEQHPRAAERIDLPGVTPAEAEYAWADAVVHPTFAEGVSNTLLEAMTIGIPCIASDIWPNREVLSDGDAGLLFAWGKADSLSANMLRLIEDASLSTKLVESGRRRIDEQYHFDRIAERYGELYRELCADPPRKADRT
jgi:glycosyltransferase involved in cell wall biosynthesis